MIVYFFKKSKEHYKSALTGILIFLCGLYGIYIVKNREEHGYSTVQIIRQNESNNSKDIQIQSNNIENHSKGDFAFVASKRGVYYYPINCSKAQALSSKNMLYFKDKTAAEVAGFKVYNGCFD